jgi:transcriptional regulator with XRE-family HTH domain
MSEHFSKNLKSLCAEHGNISQICRDIGVNRQQFNRYLNGASLPSAHNMRRIARHFDLTEAELFAETASFERMLKGVLPQFGNTTMDAFIEPFRGQQKSLRRYVGYYHSYFCTPSWEGKIFCSLIRIQEVDGLFTIRSREIATSPDNSTHQISRYSTPLRCQNNLETPTRTRIRPRSHSRVRDLSSPKQQDRPHSQKAPKRSLKQPSGTQWLEYRRDVRFPFGIDNP